MIQTQIKLQISHKQEQQLNDWLFRLTGVYNWAIRKIELDGKDGIYYSEYSFKNLLANHGKKIDIPSHTIVGMLENAYRAWKRCYKKIGGKPKLKGMRNKLNSIPFPDPLRNKHSNRITHNKVSLPGLPSIRYHKQDIPQGDIKCARLVKRANGWFLCLFIDAERKPIERLANNEVGIDPGFKDLLTLSNGIKFDRPTELAKAKKRIGQAQRGKRKSLVARLHQKIKNQRKDRNHKLSLKLIQENVFIAFSKDNHAGIARKFGKSVSNSAHGQLQQMLAYKSRTGGTKYIEVCSKNSTRICSACGSLTGPTGWTGLKVRQWVCSCGTAHDRDINAAINTYLAGVGATHERLRKVA